MYLTQFRFNTARRGALNLLRSRHRIHGAVMKSFADLTEPSADADGRILWRVDQDGDERHLYIASPRKPDLTHLVEQAGWPTTQTWRTVDYSLLLDRLAAGQRWGFRLVANPTHAMPSDAARTGDRSSDGGRERGRRLGHVTAGQQEAWLLRRQDDLGITLESDSEQTFRVTRRSIDRFDRGEHKVTLAIAQYDGVLVVEDPVILRTAMVRGIGPAKGYGCGMLTLAPV